MPILTNAPIFLAQAPLHASEVTIAAAPEGDGPLDWSTVFTRPAPIHVDLGCGDGSFLLTLAQVFPTLNFLGVDRRKRRTAKVCRKAARGGLRNVRVLQAENRDTVSRLLAPASVAAIYVQFPDPWPKRRHWVRRLVDDKFMRAAETALAPGGELWLATDDPSYFQQMQSALGGFIPETFVTLEWPDDDRWPATDFERRFLDQGLPIYRARVRKR